MVKKKEVVTTGPMTKLLVAERVRPVLEVGRGVWNL